MLQAVHSSGRPFTLAVQLVGRPESGQNTYAVLRVPQSMLLGAAGRDPSFSQSPGLPASPWVAGGSPRAQAVVPVPQGLPLPAMDAPAGEPKRGLPDSTARPATPPSAPPPPPAILSSLRRVASAACAALARRCSGSSVVVWFRPTRPHQPAALPCLTSRRP
jgi:hypothetical protein